MQIEFAAVKQLSEGLDQGLKKVTRGETDQPSWHVSTVCKFAKPHRKRREVCLPGQLVSTTISSVFSVSEPFQDIPNNGFLIRKEPL